MVVMVGISLLENIKGTLTGENVDTPSSRVVKEIVRIAGDFGGSDFLSAFGIKDEQSRWRPSSDEEAVVGFVERHGEVIFGGCDWPTGDDLATYNVIDFDLLLVRDIDEQPSSRLFELKRFGMSIDDDFKGLLAI